MTIEVERMIATLEANFSRYDKALRKAIGDTDKSFKRIETRGKKLETSLASVGSGVARNFAAAFAGGVSLRGAQQLLDASTRIQNALKVTGLEGAELSKVYDRLFQSAQANSAPLESLVELYSRAAQSAKDLGASQEELLTFTDNVSLALRVSGKSAEESSGALLQLAQALGNGVVQAEEYNSLLDGAQPLLQATAAGLKEAGGSVSALTRLVKAGKVSSEAFFRAFEAGSGILRDKVATSETTVSSAFVRLQNVLIDSATRLGDSTDASRILSNVIDNSLIPAIRELEGIFSGLVNGPLGEFYNLTGDIIDRVVQLSADLGALSGLDQIGGKPYIGPARIQDRIDGAFAGIETSKPAGTPAEVTVTKGTVIKPVTLADYKVPAKSGSGRRKRENDYQREIGQIKERTAALQAETAAQAGVNPLIDDYGYAVERAAAVQDLLNAAQEAGIAVTPALRAQIETLATGYANASVAAAQLNESQARARETAQAFQDLGKDVMGGFISDLREGKSATDALAGALEKVASKLLDLALTNLFSSRGLGSGGGVLGGLLIPGILHKGGVAGRDGYGHGRSVSPSTFAGARRYHEGGVAGLRPGEVPAILQRGEVVTPKGAKASGGRQGVHVTVGVDVDSSGNLMPFVSSVAQKTTASGLQQARPLFARDSVNAVQQSSRNRPAYLR